MRLSKEKQHSLQTNGPPENLNQSALHDIASTNTKLTFTPHLPSGNQLMDTLIESPISARLNFAEAIFKAEGSAGLERIYTDPPKSTEQLLHPEKYLQEKNQSALLVKILASILGEDWEPLYKGPIGEWKTYLLLTHNLNPYLQLDPQTAQRAAAGWDGDLTQIFTNFLWPNYSTLSIGYGKLKGSNPSLNLSSEQHASRMVGGLEARITKSNLRKEHHTRPVVSLPLDMETIWLVTPDVETASLILENYSPISGE